MQRHTRDKMAPVRRYQATVFDSDRWDGFELRPGDILICTPPKCGTTWTQMICALLVLQEPELPLPLDTLSPWLDMVTRARKDVFAHLAAQTHRRFVKTHTPLDGIPNDPTVTYICVGRDPRDVALSMDHHIDNMDIPAFLDARSRAAAIDGIELGPLLRPPPRPDGERDRFWQWVDNDTPSTRSGSSLRFTVEHLQTFRNAGDDLDVVSLHYDDLKADLEGQMRELAAHLGIDVAEDRWPRLVRAASFDSMRSNAHTMVPAGGPSHWVDPTAFFNRGTSGQWRDLLDDADLARYAARVRALAPDDLVDWLHRDPLD
jgi:aryl sulfotransferase